jgi:vitamin B12 transporter
MGDRILKRRILVFFAFTASSVVTDFLHAQTPEAPTPDQSLQEIVVVATRSPEPLAKIGNSVTVLDEPAILASQEVALSDLIVQTPGLNLARNGGIGQVTSVFIRGADSDQTVVLIDGVLFNDPSTPASGFDFARLMTADVERIEILRGAQSTLYGSQAIGGVINVITKQPTTPFEGDFAIEGGSHDTGYATGGIGGKDEALTWRLAANWYGTSGIPTFDEKLGGKRLSASQVGGTNGSLRYDLTPDLQLDVRAYYTESRTDFDGYDTPPNYSTFGDDNEYGWVKQFLQYTGLTLRSPDWNLTNRIAFQYTDSSTHDYDPNQPQSLYAVNADTETYYGIGRNLREEYQGTWDALPVLHAVFGAQHERSTFVTDTPAFDFTPDVQQNYVDINSGYGQLQYDVGRGLTLTAGGRYDHHNVFGGHATGQFAAAWVLNDGQTVLRSSFGTGFKAPSLYQLYSDIGNPALRPEVAESFDAGVEQHLWDGRVQLSGTYFQSHSRDLIEYVDCITNPGPLCVPDPYGYYINVNRASVVGGELQGALKLTPDLTFAANYTYTYSEDRSPGSPTFGNELARRPHNMANASLNYSWIPPLTTTLAARYGGRSYDNAANTVALGGYVLFDLRIAYALRDNLELYGRIENFTGKHYETAYEYGTLSRVGYAGIRTKF